MNKEIRGTLTEEDVVILTVTSTDEDLETKTSQEVGDLLLELTTTQEADLKTTIFRDTEDVTKTTRKKPEMRNSRGKEGKGEKMTIKNLSTEMTDPKSTLRNPAHEGNGTKENSHTVEDGMTVGMRVGDAHRHEMYTEDPTMTWRAMSGTCAMNEEEEGRTVM